MTMFPVALIVLFAIFDAPGVALMLLLALLAHKGLI